MGCFLSLQRKNEKKKKQIWDLKIWNGQYFNSREGEGGEALKRERIQCQPTNQKGNKSLKKRLEKFEAVLNRLLYFIYIR